MNNKLVPVAWVSAAIVVAFPIFGCIINSAYGVEALPISCKIYNLMLHVIAAIGFVAIALLGGKLLVPFMRGFGIIFMSVALIGFLGMNLQTGYQWLDVISINALNYIDLGLGVLLSAVGSIFYKHQCLITLPPDLNSLNSESTPVS